MTAKEKLERAAVGTALDQILKYIDKDPKGNLMKLYNLGEKLLNGTFDDKYLSGIRKAIEDENNVYFRYAMSLLRDIDRPLLKKLLLSMGLGGYRGTKAVRENRDIYKCNIPFLILMDPTSACNRNCKGCWSAEYGHQQNLTYDEMNSVVNQGVELGTHLYLFTGGEPLIRKKDIIALCEEHPDCAFLVFTNATLVDQAFCEEMKRVGNITLAISVEGSEETNDARRGEGAFQTTMEAMQLLKKNGCLFGMSVCYTSQNIETVTSEKFIKDMMDNGVKFAMYFHYMPVGHDAVPELIPTPEQRKHMYSWLKAFRRGEMGQVLSLIHI